MPDLPYKVTLRIPFSTTEHAEIAKNTLSPDPIVKSIQEFNINYQVKDNLLIILFEGVSNRIIRVTISNTIDNLKTILECIDEFDGLQDSTFEIDNEVFTG
ncbi:EKC/KEOPS complex subunit PCC1 [Spathaspora sp. JA1]|nr:EKC/KEOPS complex subunit PCC1 [Spathaspora sp. JA1]